MLAVSFGKVTLELLEAFGTNCLIFALTLLFALPLGLAVSFGSMSKFRPLRYLMRGIIWIVRGTPLMLQIFIIFFVPGLVFHVKWSGNGEMIAVIISFSLNYACYFSEIFRGGIEGIPRGQYEAAQVLGLSKGDTFRRIIFPQVVKRIVPPMSNEIITLVKDTSLARVIGIMPKEIIMVAQDTVNVQSVIWPLFYTGVFFLLFNGLLTLLFGYLEKKLNYYR